MPQGDLSMPNIRLEQFVGVEVQPYLNDLARLRIDIFRDYPYLYAGDLDYEMRYLQTYSRSPESLFVMAFDGETVIGASTGVPMVYEEAAFKQHHPRRLCATRWVLDEARLSKAAEADYHLQLARFG